MGRYYGSKRLNPKRESVSLELTKQRLDVELKRFALKVLKLECQNDRELKRVLITTVLGIELPEC